MDSGTKQFRYSKRAVIFFFVCVIVFSAIMEVFYALTQSDTFVLILMWVPGIAGLIACFLTLRDNGERASIKGAFSLIGIRRSKVWYVCLGVILPLIYLFVPYRIYWTMHPEYFSSAGTTVLSLLIYGVIYICISMLTALGEELGWRGFMLPALLERMGLVKVMIVVNLFWCLWHYGLLIFGGYMEGTPLWYKLPAFTLCIFPVGVMTVLLTIWSKSVWPAAFLHAAHNAFDQAMLSPLTQGDDRMYFVSETGVFTILCAWILAVVMLVIHVNRQTIYKSEEGKQKVLALYDAQLERLGIPHKDLYVETSFGTTHLIETGNFEGEPLLVFHGGNATTAYNLLYCDFLFEDFHVFAVDTIGQPGKSAETSLSAANYAYGVWAGEVIDRIGHSPISLFGGSFGGGIIAKTMCAVPDKIKRVVIYIPSGIRNTIQLKNARLLYPMTMFALTRKDEWLKRAFLYMALVEENITDDVFETAKLSILHTKVKTLMPTNVSASRMKKCQAPTLVMAAELDCLFPGPCVLKRAKKIIPNCETYLLEGRGHMHFLSDEEKRMIVEFLLK